MAESEVLMNVGGVDRVEPDCDRRVAAPGLVDERARRQVTRLFRDELDGAVEDDLSAGVQRLFDGQVTQAREVDGREVHRQVRLSLIHI